MKNLQPFSSHLLPAALAVAMAASGCTGTDEPAPAGDSLQATEAAVAVSFTGSATEPAEASRASTPLATGYVMYVNAIHHSATGNVNIPFFGTEQKFGHDGTVWRCASGDIYYPPTGTMDFVAYAIADEAHKPLATYNLTDYDYAFGSVDLDFGTTLTGDDPVVFGNLVRGALCGPDASTLPLQFNHAMAKIVFALRTSDDATAQRLTINRISLKDVCTSGVASYLPGSEAAWHWTELKRPVALLDVPGVPASGVKPHKATSSSDHTGTIFGTPLYLPTLYQFVTPASTDVSIEIEYTFYNGSSASFGTDTVTIPLSGEYWARGRQYTYMLTCTLRAISLELVEGGVLIDNWNDETIDSEANELLR